MTVHPFSLLRKNAEVTGHPVGKHPLGRLESSRFAKHLSLFRARPEDIDLLVATAQRNIPGVASPQTVRKVVAHNPDCLWTIARKSTTAPEWPAAEGFIAMLPLTMAGLCHLAANTFNGTDPDLGLIAKPGEKPAGIYIWAIHAPGRLVGAVTILLDEVQAPPYDGLNVYTRPNTDDGFRFNETLGFRKGPVVCGIHAPHLYEFVRAPETVPLYDSRRPSMSGQEISVTVVRSFDDLIRVASIRSIVFIGEQECPYEEEFDGNDMSGTHLLGYVGNEPVACVRVRYFADFAKIERVAVRKEYRQTRVSIQLVRACIELCRMKGYRRLYGHAQKRLVPFWNRLGFKLFDGGRELVFSDFDYVEMVAEFQPHPEAIAIGGDPYKVNRPEGRWHIPGILEMSAARNVTRPSIGA